MSGPFALIEDEKTSHSHHLSTSPLISRPKPKTSSSRSILRRSSKAAKPVLVIHGGAGTLDRAKYTEAQIKVYREALRGALQAGHRVLENDGEALDAVVAAVEFMENCPLFNSGHGAVFNTEGKNELEASIALSHPPSTHPHIPQSRISTALTLLTHTRNPILLARALYLSPSTTPHVLHGGLAAEKLGLELGQTMVDPSYFWTEGRWREHRRGLGLPEEPFPDGRVPGQQPGESGQREGAKGTVGAVALDSRGCIAAATSTGGRTNKLPGRIGDTPCFGSGYWAGEWEEKSSLRRFYSKLVGRSTKKAMGVSGTGDGDYFIRLNTGSSLAAYIKLKGYSLDKACRKVTGELKEVDAVGGVIAINERGQVSLSLNGSGMYRGVIEEDGVPKVAIFHDEELQ
ncbi:asparaginase [Mrakia frigida]|uniref:isoaspartyl peptidase/L-asparaginase n=1 Tax=Mrakia frigida TaxID=29902 RepID=UPI003FCBFE66